MGYFLWVTCSFGILFLSEIIIMYIRGVCVCVEFFVKLFFVCLLGYF